jgi:hypothetical protein
MTAKKIDLGLRDVVRCYREERDVTADECSSSYCNADAKDLVEDRCYRCDIGRKVRAALARSVWPRRRPILLAFLSSLEAKRFLAAELEELAREDAEAQVKARKKGVPT